MQEAHENPTPNPLKHKFNLLSFVSLFNRATMVKGIDAELVLPNSSSEYGTFVLSVTFNFFLTDSLISLFA